LRRLEHVACVLLKASIWLVCAGAGPFHCQTVDHFNETKKLIAPSRCFNFSLSRQSFTTTLCAALGAAHDDARAKAPMVGSTGPVALHLVQHSQIEV